MMRRSTLSRMRRTSPSPPTHPPPPKCRGAHPSSHSRRTTTCHTATSSGFVVCSAHWLTRSTVWSSNTATGVGWLA
jgi:aromatic ring-opening dioxygenase catalytic subunit (LigB family)